MPDKASATASFGNNIRTIRARMGMTQRELAGVLGITPMALSRYELGQRQPRYSTLYKMASILDVTIEQLVGQSVPAEAASTIGTRIYEARKAANLSQTELASLTNVPVKDINRYEQDASTPPYSVAEAIARILGVSTVYLLTGEETDEQTVPAFGHEKRYYRRAARMMDSFARLSPSGQAEAVRLVEMLTYVPEYQKGN